MIPECKSFFQRAPIAGCRNVDFFNPAKDFGGTFFCSSARQKIAANQKPARVTLGYGGFQKRGGRSWKTR
jgi:hypothetical protein